MVLLSMNINEHLVILFFHIYLGLNVAKSPYHGKQKRKICLCNRIGIKLYRALYRCQQRSMTTKFYIVDYLEIVFILNFCKDYTNVDVSLNDKKFVSSMLKHTKF